MKRLLTIALARASMWFIIAAMCALCLSCSTTRKLNRSTIESSASTTQNDIRSDSTALAVRADSSRVVVETERGSVEVRHVVTYDTSRPVDSLTGRPPVASESTSHRYSGSRAKSVANSGSAQSSAVRLLAVDSSRVAASSASKEQVAEQVEVDASAGWLTWLIIGAVLALVIAIAIRWLYRRLRPRLL